MATRRRTVDEIMAQCSQAGSMSARTMFGEYGLYCDGRIVALICDDQLYLKPTAAGRAYLGQVVEAPAYPGAKPSFLISGERWEDADWLSEVIRVTAAALPAAKPRRRKAQQPR